MKREEFGWRLDMLHRHLEDLSNEFDLLVKDVGQSFEFYRQGVERVVRSLSDAAIGMARLADATNPVVRVINARTLEELTNPAVEPGKVRLKIMYAFEEATETVVAFWDDNDVVHTRRRSGVPAQDACWTAADLAIGWAAGSDIDSILVVDVWDDAEQAWWRFHGLE